MGSPTVNPKNNRLEIRLTDSEKNMLDECVRRTGINKTGVIIKGISKVYNSTQKQRECSEPFFAKKKELI